LSAGAPKTGGVRTCKRRGPEIYLELRNTIDAVEDGRRELLTFFDAHELPGRTINHLEVVFEELVSNVIRHGFTRGSDQSIRVRCSALASGVQLVIEDDGAPFDPLVAPAPPKPESLETARLGGLGIPLVIKLASAVRYDALPERGGGGPSKPKDFEPRNRLTVTVPILT
jgi:serine/threonine-protein kinase RsbW